MNVSDIVAATVTLARDAQEEQLLRDALGALSTIGCPIAVCDGGSPETLREFLAALPRVTMAPLHGSGLAAQVRSVLREATTHRTPALLYTESDKHHFFRDHLGEFVASSPADDGVGIVLAGRSQDSFATYPAAQRMGETTINALMTDTIGVEADYSYGPFLFRPELVRYLDLVPADIGWGWRHFIFTVAHRLGYRVEQIEGEYRCPPDQRDEPHGDRLHRLRQLAQNIQGLILGSTIDLDGVGAPGA